MEETVEQTPEVETPKQFDNPYDFLKTIPGAPNEDALKIIKAQTPNQRLRVFTPDKKRVFILRGISGLELDQIQLQLTPNLAPEKSEAELYNLVGARCTVWTNATTKNKMEVTDFKAGSAGLPSAVFQLVQALSDFIEPDVLAVMSAEL